MKWRVLVVLFFLIISENIARGNNNSFNPFSLNTSLYFSCPGIDESHIVIYPSACNAADGSITGIIGTGGTGTLTYTWYTLDNVVLSTGADLLNMPAGSYILEIKDQSKCLPAKKTYTIGQRFSAIIDTSQIKITPSSCTANNGSITNISVTNATQYQWFDVNKNPLATNSDLINVPSGLYTLVVTPATGCTFTKTYQVPSSAHFPTVSKTDTTMGICGYTVGTYTLTFNLSPTDPIYSYQLLDPTSAVASGDAGDLLYTDGSPVQITFPIPLANIQYTLVLTQTQNYCSQAVGTYSLPEPVFALVDGPFFKVTNDACGRHTGGVSGLHVVGGSPVPANPLPQKYTWADSLGNVVGRQPELSDVGKWHLHCSGSGYARLHRNKAVYCYRQYGGGAAPCHKWHYALLTRCHYFIGK